VYNKIKLMECMNLNISKSDRQKSGGWGSTFFKSRTLINKVLIVFNARLLKINSFIFNELATTHPILCCDCVVNHR